MTDAIDATGSPATKAHLSMSLSSPFGSLDIAFDVPCVHRLRFTADVLRGDSDVLLELMERSADRPARVQFWIDSRVEEANPDLKSKIRRFVTSHRDQIEMPGNIQVAPGGEEVKNDIHVIERILKCINAADLDRRSYIVVIGGGAILDAVGFAAAIAHRGIRLIRLPTTTLAQADSGVGVKNSVNLFQKKNWVGTFSVPWGVVNDAALLETLPDRDFVCGFSEAVKVSLLKDADEFGRICLMADRIRRRDMQAAGPVIRRSAQLHIEHITRRGRPVRRLGGPAFRLRPLVGSPAGGDEQLRTSTWRSGRNWRGGRYSLLLSGPWTSRRRCPAGARMPASARLATGSSGTP